MEKRAIFINRVNELEQEFYCAHPLVVKLYNIFNTYFYGSSLWDLFGTESKRLEKHGMSRNELYWVYLENHIDTSEPLSQTRHVIFALYGVLENLLVQLQHQGNVRFPSC